MGIKRLLYKIPRLTYHTYTNLYPQWGLAWYNFGHPHYLMINLYYKRIIIGVKDRINFY